MATNRLWDQANSSRIATAILGNRDIILQLTVGQKTYVGKNRGLETVKSLKTPTRGATGNVCAAQRAEQANLFPLIVKRPEGIPTAGEGSRKMLVTLCSKQRRWP